MLLGTEVFPSFAIHDPMPAWVGDLKSPSLKLLYLCKHKDGGHRVKQAQRSQEWENEGYLYNKLHMLHMFILMFDSFFVCECGFKPASSRHYANAQEVKRCQKRLQDVKRGHKMSKDVERCSRIIHK